MHREEQKSRQRLLSNRQFTFAVFYHLIQSDRFAYLSFRAPPGLHICHSVLDPESRLSICINHFRFGVGKGVDSGSLFKPGTSCPGMKGIKNCDVSGLGAERF
jgi:hypothetical protein